MSTARIGGKIIIIDIGEVYNCGPCPRKHAPALHFQGCFVEDGEEDVYKRKPTGKSSTAHHYNKECRTSSQEEMSPIITRRSAAHHHKNECRTSSQEEVSPIIPRRSAAHHHKNEYRTSLQ
jgi:hypothetical protein